MYNAVRKWCVTKAECTLADWLVDKVNIVMKDIIFLDNVYEGFSFIICLTIVTLILIVTFRLHTAGLHQAIMSIY